MRFKKRSHFHGFMVSHGKAGKAGYVDVEAITSLPEDLAEIIYKGNYTKQQIFFFYGDETALYWKKMSSRTF